MKIGYARCSSYDQNPARQLELLQSKGCEKVYLDMMSGKDRNRPELNTMLDFAREGDVIYVESISRLARSTRDLLNLIDEMAKKGIQFVSEKENIDTSTPQGKFMLTVFGAMAELERNNIRQRQAEGIAIAKKEGKYQGRQPKQFDQIEFKDLYHHWKDGDITQIYMCKRLNVSLSTLRRRIREYERNL